MNELRAIVTDEQDTRLPIDVRASVIVLAAQLAALESVMRMAVVNELLFLCMIAALAVVIALARDDTFFAFLFAMAGGFALGSAVLRSGDK